MNNRYFKIDGAGYIVAITVGAFAAPGFQSVAQTEEERHIGIGWSLIDGEYVDTTAAYRALIRQNN